MPSKKSKTSSKNKRPAPVATSTLGLATQFYRGKSEKLVISIDIGTTCSAASLCYLKPQRPINLEIVSGWPGQTSEQEHKVPSVIYYDQTGKVVGWGAETTNPVFRDRALKEDWVRVEWLALHWYHDSILMNGRFAFRFKLSLKPPHTSTDMEDHNIPKLPSFLKGQKIYSDFLAHMFRHIKEYFSKHHAGGNALWEKLLPTADMVFTVPSGWELKQQYEIRRAAVHAGFMGNMTTREADPERERLQRKKEKGTQAAMVYAADSERVDAWLQTGKSVIVCDAGGGTIDISAYEIKEEYPLKLEERLAPKYKTRKTPWNTEQKIDQLVDFFERETKKRLTYPTDKEYIVGPGGSNETFHPSSGVRNGFLYLPAYEFERFFEPTMMAIKDGIQDMWEKSRRTLIVSPSTHDTPTYLALTLAHLCCLAASQNVIMVGGLMNSSYAFKQLELWGAEIGINFAKPDGTMAKAVSHGALLWYLAKPVTGYIMKYHYGSDVCLRARELSDELLRGRETHLEGEILDPNVELCVDFEKYLDEDEPVDASRFEDKIYICRNEEEPVFLTNVHGQLNPGIEHICTIVIDLTRLFNHVPWSNNVHTRKRYKCLKVLPSFFSTVLALICGLNQYSIAIMNDGYDIDAYSYWTFQGKPHVGDAKVLVPAIAESRSPSPS
ncbi:hypothetical protein NP233_g4201 [Leucocoprinus birnbaumii]|uniref:Uncharacterized protein n=1 Tax=Leucocoprinus birnbaumii TaxID=56174 RepID=A0AAD5VXP3_9AGAR|nr:hypothetical protein NP233_g4201 [Leucocoprinus birnbaumii]